MRKRKENTLIIYFQKVLRRLSKFLINSFLPFEFCKKKTQNASLWRYLLSQDAVFLTYVTYFYAVKFPRSGVVSKMFDLGVWIWPRVIIGIFSAKRNWSHRLRQSKMRKEQNESKLCDDREQVRKLWCLTFF